jgi:hypothetical protein
VDDVFSTYLWVGDQTARNIVNGIDLATEGGLVWTKNRDTSGMSHALVDTERGANKILTLPSTGAELDSSGAYGVNGFNTDGFSLPSGEGAYYENKSGKDAASWTFRKAPKFFDVVTYTGNGSNQTISHDLGSVPGMIIVKDLDTGGNWRIYHRSLGNTFGMDFSTQAKDDDVYWNDTTPTGTVFTVGPKGDTNTNGTNYVAYLFAHNDGDGGFGPDGDADIIKCGSFTYSNGLEVNLGFEPQWLLYKQSSTSGHWRMVDNMRGWGVPSTEKFLYPSLTNAEASGGQIDLTSTGFRVHDAGTGDYIYIAIRRGPLAVPESATDVFAAAFGVSGVSNPAWNSGFPVDMAIDSNVGGGSTDSRTISSRLTQGRYLELNQYQQEYAWSNYSFDYMTGYRDTNNGSSDMAWMWKRAPGFFDVVAYTGNGVGPRNVPHNLGVAPEMIWNKTRTQNDSWLVYHKDVPLDSATQTAGLIFQSNGTPGGYGSFGEHSGQTATTFEIAPTNDPSGNNENGTTFMAYLFATLDGISKVGSYTGNGSNQTINCGFSAGARFILIKRIDANGDWYVWDTVRGIITGSETALIFNSTLSTYNDSIDPANSGFIVNQISATNINVSNATYIFYAIA